MTDVMAENEMQYPDTPFNLYQSLILLARRGSEAHGMYIPPSDPNSIDDRDIMGICIPPMKYYTGLDLWEGADSIKGCWDMVLYELKKFARLLVKQNPNVLSMLYLEDEDYLYHTRAGSLLLASRTFFKERDAAYNSFVGYSISQLKKMENGAFKGYMGEKRKALVEKFGHDTKCASHLIRLLHVGIEYLQEGKLQVKRTWDRELLLDIKAGRYKLDEVKKMADVKLDEIRKAYEESSLPEEIDMELVNHTIMECCRMHFEDAEEGVE